MTYYVLSHVNPSSPLSRLVPHPGGRGCGLIRGAKKNRGSDFIHSVSQDDTAQSSMMEQEARYYGQRMAELFGQSEINLTRLCSTLVALIASTVFDMSFLLAVKFRARISKVCLIHAFAAVQGGSM